MFSGCRSARATELGEGKVRNVCPHDNPTDARACALTATWVSCAVQVPLGTYRPPATGGSNTTSSAMPATQPGTTCGGPAVPDAAGSIGAVGPSGPPSTASNSTDEAALAASRTVDSDPGRPVTLLVTGTGTGTGTPHAVTDRKSVV